MAVFLKARWPSVVNALVVVFIVGALLAPVLDYVGFSDAANGLYAAYHLVCHQWAMRSFFLFGPQAVYGVDELPDPYAFVGSAALGWKMALCERDVAIYVAALLAGLWYARHRGASALSSKGYLLLCLPMAVDGFTQLFGWRESTWELRVVTGVLFGAASVWFLYPRFDSWRYAPDRAWAVQQAPPG